MSGNPVPGSPGSGSPVARTLRWIALGALAIGVLAILGDVLLLVFAACLIAVVLVRASRFVARHVGIRRGISLALLLVLLVAALAAALWWRGPAMATEAARLAGRLDDRLGEVRRALDGTPIGAEIVSRVRDYLSNQPIAGATRGVATATLGALGSLVVLLAASIYFAASPGLYVDGVLLLLPPSWRGRGREVLAATGETLFWWFTGQLIDMLVVGALSYAGLALLGVPLAGTLALIAALLNFVPYVGAIAGAVPAVIVAFGLDTALAAETAVVFLAIQTLEGNVIAPLIQRRTIDLPPVVTILSQTVLGTLFGPAGLVLATPIAAALMVAVRMVYVEDVLGDRQP